MAEAFDRWLPYIQPVAEALIDLADISAGHRILDVASGTGEPSLTLARRHHHQNIQIIGIDGAEAMVQRANQKAEAEGLSCLSFQQMSAENLRFENAKFDRVISRFGVMLFDDPAKGLDEMRRVLRHEGKMAIAVWGEFHLIEGLFLIWDTLMKVMPKADHPSFPRIGKLGAPGALETLLEEAGFEDFDVNPFSLSYRYDNFESYWKTNTEADLLKEPLDTLSPAKKEALKKEVEALASSYQKDGQFVFENEALLASAIK